MTSLWTLTSEVTLATPCHWCRHPKSDWLKIFKNHWIRLRFGPFVSYVYRTWIFLTRTNFLYKKPFFAIWGMLKWGDPKWVTWVTWVTLWKSGSPEWGTRTKGSWMSEARQAQGPSGSGPGLKLLLFHGCQKPVRLEDVKHTHTHTHKHTHHHHHHHCKTYVTLT